MYIEERQQYQVSCIIDRKDMKQHGVLPEAFVNRTPLAMMLIKKARGIAVQSTNYEWPECGFSMEMKFYPDGIELIFSERIEDFVYNLEQSVLALPQEQGQDLQRVITMIKMAEDENAARKIIREFESNIKNIQ